MYTYIWTITISLCRTLSLVLNHNPWLLNPNGIGSQGPEIYILHVHMNMMYMYIHTHSRHILAHQTQPT